MPTPLSRLCLLLTLGLFLTGCAQQSEPVQAVLGADGVQQAKIVVKHGYSPMEIKATAGKPLKVEFFRDEPEGESCTEELVIPALGFDKALPAGKSEIVEIRPQKAGAMEFHCGMDMIKGKIVFE